MRHTPQGRGYQSSLGYFHHANDYYTEGIPYAAIGTVNVCDNKFVDLWANGGYVVLSVPTLV
jgi:arylsulfatase I/J